MILGEDDYLAHYGILRKSGRYPWGSGANPNQRARTFIDTIEKLRSEGISDTEIAKMFSTEDHPFTTRHLRETNTIARNAKKAADIAQAQSLRDQGHSNMGIGKKMGINESSVRSLLAEGQKEKLDILTTTASQLRDQVDAGVFLDIGKGVENQMGISKEKLGSAVAILKDEGYVVLNVQTPTATKNKTTVKVLCPPDTTYRDVVTNMDNITQITKFSDDGGRSYFGLLPPKSLDSSRIAINYKEDGGDLADGVMYVRPGVEDLSLGGARYAQVRVLVDGTHYLKGMAMYKDDLPEGVDVLFNTNKSKKDVPNKLDALKEVVRDVDGNIDKDNPFGAMVDQIGIHDERGDLIEVTSVMNRVNKEGDWEGWKNSISSQVLSKQSQKLAKQQLDKAYDAKKAEFDEIMALNNPAVRKKLLRAYSESVDAAAVHLKAAALPRQASHVILPVNSMKETEIYAPNYRDGERVALIRYPHGGTFEIPELTVNNRHAEAKSLLGQAKDAVGINAKVAERLSGADFDGDTVLVIPNDSNSIKTSPALESLKNFDPKSAYPAYEGMPAMSSKSKGTQMGIVSNLITDMTIQGATTDDLARAVKHSMVVIDAEKHNLNWKESAKRNGIRALQEKYQQRDDGNVGGAATLISRATSEQRVRARKARTMAKGGPIDKATGKRMWEEKGDSWVDPKTGKTRYPEQKSVKLRETDDAYTLVSKNGGTPIERVYADYSNRMKAMANAARLAEVNTGNVVQSKSAKAVYAKEVESLNAKLNTALKNSPLERQAQLFANATLSAKRAANPNMDSAQIKRANAQALAEGRRRTGAKKELVNIEPREWEAIQAGAISNHKLNQILENTNIEQVKTYATPRPTRLMSGTALSKAKAMAAAGRTQAEIADALGVSVTTVKEGLK
jgi:hypothetical protein